MNLNRSHCDHWVVRYIAGTGYSRKWVQLIRWYHIWHRWYDMMMILTLLSTYAICTFLSDTQQGWRIQCAFKNDIGRNE